MFRSLTPLLVFWSGVINIERAKQRLDKTERVQTVYQRESKWSMRCSLTIFKYEMVPPCSKEELYFTNVMTMKMIRK